ncbi:MAG TPA: ABC transporter ATP-binding protein [Terriglobales bacterium]|jgi:ABC-2 type transport system ATP-binding protein|nr:ABC transporter ATP-binding protein [Terriglobales bacterium]
MAAIETFALEKIYLAGFWRKRPKVALKPLTISVQEGEVFGYLGPNGAGKTTTLKLLMGLIFPTGGSAKIEGADWRDPQVKAQIGFLPEQPYFYDYLTAGELLDYYAQLSGVSARERRRRIPAVLSRVGLPETGRMQLRKFSKGMLQRVGIAQAIIHDPKLIFLDEPMSGLDPVGRREVRDLIQSFKDEGKTVFFSTHILSDAEALCDRVAVLHKGELRGVGVVQDLLARFSGKVEVIWDGRSALNALQSLCCECHSTGETTRALLPQEQLDAAIDAIRRARGRLISVTPLRASLEDYFLEKLNEPAPAEVAP